MTSLIFSFFFFFFFFLLFARSRCSCSSDHSIAPSNYTPAAKKQSRCHGDVTFSVPAQAIGTSFSRCHGSPCAELLPIQSTASQSQSQSQSHTSLQRSYTSSGNQDKKDPSLLRIPPPRRPSFTAGDHQRRTNPPRGIMS
ncbi:hypothetical protein M441DRAFT_303195 [Trichoderma asperellum CBS 433.97]|uniref:Secreted protein n=1 Tax=Trichoderma asperellum (strain ATCC 204424 / CBS 433.97 / NBRC 101777) TaxID=1042311 RepID=A0A2T3ZJL2_TRIA4|nr:hypothetical protein M441DRAFT_303195 [Trichoderma asperellum CBS 433.97]PTB44990.1 hypothetical protein M441DRAFT_303195 [Trichoderma asperellum CBS 433.97]